MIDEGAHLQAAPVRGWYDCGTIDALLETNRILLQNGHQRTAPVVDSVIIPPVYIEEGVHIHRSIIGPYVSVAPESSIENSIVHDSIINEGAVVRDALLQRSLIGERAFVKGGYKRLNVGDSSTIQDE
jgi:glucose-1-phosphate thymidylyltransferase